MLDQTRRFPEPPPRRERIFNIPPAIGITLVVLLALHAARRAIPEAWDDQLLLRLAFVPGTFTYAFDPAAVLAGLRKLLDAGDAGLRQAQLGRYILTSAGLEPWTVLTYGVLHADWPHVGLNGLWLLAFGTPVARRLGTRRFWLFLAIATVAGAFAHYAAHPAGLLPVIGASAAVSGCMGAALRFMFQPEVPVSAIISLNGRKRDETFHPPLQPLLGLFRDRRAMAFLVVWFATNALFGFGVVALGTADGAVAWQAHIGGFLFGLLALPLFDQGAAGQATAGRSPLDGPHRPDEGGPVAPP